MVAEANSTSPADLPARRVVLLGASNLAHGIATVIDACHRQWGQPLDCLAALGHGRSYGTRSTVLGRTLPSIQSCRLWSALDERPAAPTAALVTDIGNDLMYEAPVDKIVVWVTRCLDQLARHDARIVMTRLPLANIEQVSEWKFRVMRRLMFPLGRSPYATIAARARELDERLRELAATRGIVEVEQSPRWYGWDPIHFRYRTGPRCGIAFFQDGAKRKASRPPVTRPQCAGCTCSRARLISAGCWASSSTGGSRARSYRTGRQYRSTRLATSTAQTTAASHRSSGIFEAASIVSRTAMSWS